MISRRSHDEFLDATLPALDLVYNLARRMVRDPDHQADLVQETYLRAFVRVHRGRKKLAAIIRREVSRHEA